MFKDPRKQEFEDKAKEAVFMQRLADLQAKNEIFPWSGVEQPQFEIPKEESKLFADRAVEGNELSDAEVEYRALLDLTSIPFNFKTFYKRLHYEIQRASRYKRDLALCLVAIDGLDEIRRQYGPDAKLAVLEHGARVLLSSIRDVDVAGRCREDCFGVILPETPVYGAEVAAMRIRTKMEQLGIPNVMEDIQITASIGGGTFPLHGKFVEELFAHTASSLMAVMNSGGNAVSFDGASRG